MLGKNSTNLFTAFTAFGISPYLTLSPAPPPLLIPPMNSICSCSLVTTSKLVGDISQVLWPVKTKKETHAHNFQRWWRKSKKQEVSPNFRLQRNLSALSVRSIRHVLCPPPTSSIITSPSLSFSWFYLYFVFFLIFGGSRKYIVHRQLPVISPPSTFLASYSFLHFHCTFCTFSAFPGKSCTKKTRKKALIRMETPEICIKQLKSATSPKNY